MLTSFPVNGAPGKGFGKQGMTPYFLPGAGHQLRGMGASHATQGRKRSRKSALQGLVKMSRSSHCKTHI